MRENHKSAEARRAPGPKARLALGSATPTAILEEMPGSASRWYRETTLKGGCQPAQSQVTEKHKESDRKVPSDRGAAWGSPGASNVREPDLLHISSSAQHGAMGSQTEAGPRRKSGGLQMRRQGKPPPDY